ncbi:MAG: hypothetical protein IPH07_11045 [Deltaproteobacteria bacterium]|jgi:hypothetical protein|nr:hypothetical protein [Deltaproteobacteria bacterium]MBK8237280.1 hypothetical protein [Deltaproteobacteria bacterium]MBK8718972.1 hypothetical protein [Deltaproteobacteria bacterium]MBP7285404.1 hypothetical protein [Nannocystaceae bacterium]
MSPEFYKVLHVFGVALLFCSLGGIALHAPHAKRGDAAATSARKRLAAAHGIAMLLVLVGGFGLMAKLGLMSTWPLWIIIKLVVWVVLGGASAFVARKPEVGAGWVFVLPLLGTIALWAVFYKPG